MKASELVEYLRKGPIAYMSDSGPVYSGGSLETQQAADLLEAQAKAIEEMREAGERWHNEFAKAFITQVSTGDGEYFITVKFRTMSQMHEAYDAMARLADLTRPGGQA